MGAELKGVEEVKRARRAAVRSVEMIRDGSLAEQEVDFARMLFGETAAEEKLAAFGLLDDGGILDNLVRRVETMILFEYQRHRPVAALAEQIEQRLLDLQRDRAEAAEKGDMVLPNGLPRKVPRPGREDVAERNARTSRSANARLLAVHLAQRALYEGLNLALAELVRRQAAGETPRTLKDSEEMRACLGHGPLAMGPDHVASAEVAINRLRKAHMAGHPERGEAPYLVMVGLADAAPSPDGPDPELSKVVGIAAE